MNKIIHDLGLVLAGIGLACAATPVFATPTGGTSRDCSVPTTVTETNFGGSAKNFILHISGPGGFGAPDLATFPLGTIPSGGSVTVNVPPLGQTNCDARNEIISLGGGSGVGSGGLGAGSDLLIEAIFLNAVTHTFQFDSYGDFILKTVGPGVVVPIPDLWAVNADGQSLAGVILYSYVNLEDYLAGPIPTFLPNETFSIVNGKVAALPGMLFSSKPFSFDPTAGVSGTPYTGAGSVFTVHDPSAIPELSTSALFFVGLLSLVLVHRAPWRSRRTPTGWDRAA